MKTAEEALKEEWAWENPVHAFRDGYNAAIEAMRAESEPVGVTDLMPAANRFTIACFEAEKVPEGTPLFIAPHKNTMRELSREEVTELWHQATQEEGGIGKVVERFAKLVREAK